MHMVTETRQLRDGEKLTEFYNRIDWKPLFEFVQRYYGIGVEQPPVPCLKPNGRIEVNWPENLRDKCGLFCHTEKAKSSWERRNKKSPLIFGWEAFSTLRRTGNLRLYSRHIARM